MTTITGSKTDINKTITNGTIKIMLNLKKIHQVTLSKPEEAGVVLQLRVAEVVLKVTEVGLAKTNKMISNNEILISFLSLSVHKIHIKVLNFKK